MKITLIAVILILTGYVGFHIYTSNVDEPEYEMIQTLDDKTEIRAYRSTIIAKTYVHSTFKDAGNEGFRKLAGYIFGNNSTNTKIAMTAPVGQYHDNDGHWITFVMPKNFKVETLPDPGDSSVIITPEGPSIKAVISYRGGWSRELYTENLEKLRKTLQSSEWVPQGKPLWARYNPPSSPWFLRRNEIMLTVVKKS